MRSRDFALSKGPFVFLIFVPIFALELVPANAQQVHPANKTGVSIVQLSDGISFGSLVAGNSEEVLVSDQRAAKFWIRLPSSKTISSVQLTFFPLPSVLASGYHRNRDTLPITFGANAAAWSYQDNVVGSLPFDPGEGETWSPPRSTTIYVWVGGTINPPVGQPSDRYSGTMTVTVTVIYEN